MVMNNEYIRAWKGVLMTCFLEYYPINQHTA